MKSWNINVSVLRLWKGFHHFGTVGLFFFSFLKLIAIVYSNFGLHFSAVVSDFHFSCFGLIVTLGFDVLGLCRSVGIVCRGFVDVVCGGFVDVICKGFVAVVCGRRLWRFRWWFYDILIGKSCVFDFFSWLIFFLFSN